MFTVSLLFGISASLDALLVGISYGIRRVRIRLWQNLTISLVTLLGTCLSVGLGHRLAGVLPSMIGEYAGSLVLIFLGLYYIAKWMTAYYHNLQAKAPPNAIQAAGNDSSVQAAPYQKPVLSQETTTSQEPTPSLETTAPRKPASSTETGSQEDEHPPEADLFLKLTEVLSLSLTLSVNNLSAGFSASLTGLPLMPAAASTFVCSVLFLFSGNRLGGSHWLQVAGCAAELLSGLLLIGLGAVQLFL